MVHNELFKHKNNWKYIFPADKEPDSQHRRYETGVYGVTQMETDFYTDEGISESLDYDQISDIEQGFMAGYLSAFGGD